MSKFQRLVKNVSFEQYMISRWKNDDEKGEKMSNLVEKCHREGCITRAESEEIAANPSLTEPQKFHQLVELLGTKKDGWKAVLQLLRESPPESDSWKVTDAQDKFPEATETPTITKKSVKFTDKLLGSGAFGKVFLCYSEDSGQPMAVKQVCIDLSSIDHDDEAAQLANEITLMSQLKHDRIVQYFGCQRDGNIVCIYMEYMPGGSILDEIKILNKEKKFLNESIIRSYSRQILEGLSYLHNCHIVHRDIKTANILKDSMGNVKIGDFGTSRRLENLFTENGLNTCIGTPYYMAPEVINGGGYGRKADIWSFGCTLLEMLTGHHPWSDLNSMAAIFAIGNGLDPLISLPATVSADLVALLKLLFTRKPLERPTAEEALSHAALQQL